MVNEDTFLIIKPDGLNLGIMRDLLKNLFFNGVRVRKQKTIYLNCKTIRKLYPKLVVENRPVTSAIINYYLMSSPVLWLQLYGRNSVKIVTDLKDGFRLLYHRNFYFSNLIHCPRTVEEYWQQHNTLVNSDFQSHSGNFQLSGWHGYTDEQVLVGIRSQCNIRNPWAFSAIISRYEDDNSAFFRMHLDWENTLEDLLNFAKNFYPNASFLDLMALVNSGLYGKRGFPLLQEKNIP